MKKVYLAGPYNDKDVIGVLKNIARGEYWASQIFMHGLAPFTPWHDKDFVIKNWTKPMDTDKFKSFSLEWLKVSDCLFIVPNCDGLKNWQDSGGTLAEIELAKEIGIPIFYSLEELLKWV